MHARLRPEGSEQNQRPSLRVPALSHPGFFRDFGPMFLIFSGGPKLPEVTPLSFCVPALNIAKPSGIQGHGPKYCHKARGEGVAQSTVTEIRRGLGGLY